MREGSIFADLQRKQNGDQGKARFSAVHRSHLASGGAAFGVAKRAVQVPDRQEKAGSASPMIVLLPRCLGDEMVF